MALIDELKERWENTLNQAHAAECHSIELYAAAEDLSRAIAALEPPAQPVHPDAELRSVTPATEEASGDQLLTAFEDDHIVSRGPLIDAQTCEEVDPRVSWDKPEAGAPEIPEGFTKWEGGGYTAFCIQYPSRDGMLIEVLFRNGDRWTGEPAGFAWDTAKELLASGWKHEDAVGGKIDDASDILYYRIISEPSADVEEIEASIQSEPFVSFGAETELQPSPGGVEESRDHLIDAQTCEEVDPRCSWKAEPAPCTCHPDDAPLECMKRYAASECQAAYSAKYFPIPAEEVPPQTYEDEADLAPEPEALDEPVQDEATTDLWQQGYNDKLNGFEPSLAEPEYLKGYEARALIEREQASTMEQAKFFAEGMMADADRHAREQSMMEKAGEALAAIFKREREDA